MAERFGTSAGDAEIQLGREARSVRAWVRLARVYGRFVRAMETQVRGHGLTLGQFDVLTHVARSEGMSQRELADQLLVTKGNVSHLLDRLEGAGLVERRAGRGRVCHLYPTEAGRALLAAIIPPHDDLIVELFAGVPAERLTALHETLRDLDRAYET